MREVCGFTALQLEVESGIANALNLLFASADRRDNDLTEFRRGGIASEQLPPEGPLAVLYAQIHALFVEAGLLAAESDDQQEQIDQLTGNPAPPELCETAVTAICACEQTVDCACDPGPYFELESCESASFPHPDFGEVPPPKCGAVAGCQGTFTRIAAGDVGSIEVDPNCAGGGGDDCSGCDNNNDPPF